MNDTNPYETGEAQAVDLSADFEAVRVFSATQRIGRIRYLAYGSGLTFLMYLIVGAITVLTIGTADLTDATQEPTAMFLVAIVVFYLVILVGSVIIGVRRLHDLDKSGWWFALFLVPLVNLGLAIYLLFFPGSPDENRYGKKPEPNTVLTWIVGLSIPILALLGIIAAVTIPAYHDYTQRANATEAIYLADQIKPAIEQIYYEEGSFKNAVNGYGGIPQEISGNSTAYIRVSDGIILAELGGNADPQLLGKQLIIEPIATENYIIWECTFTGEPRYAPADCH